MARYGIAARKVFGVSVGALRQYAPAIGRDHDLAAALWDTGWYEARMLAAFVEDPARVTFALLASLALHDRETSDDRFLACLPLTEHTADDELNFVKKGVSWGAALSSARRLAASTNPAARWIGRDSIRDLSRPSRKKGAV